MLTPLQHMQLTALHSLHPLTQAVLVSRLQNKDTGSQTSNSLMKAVLVCDKFLTGAQGTQAELDVLKSQVRLTLAQQVPPHFNCAVTVLS